MLCAGCVEEAHDPGIEATSRVTVFDLPAAPAPQLDMLFIVDDTSAMAAYQDRVAEIPAALEQKFRVLDATGTFVAGGIIDMHLAVTTNGELRRNDTIGGSFMTCRPATI